MVISSLMDLIPGGNNEGIIVEEDVLEVITLLIMKRCVIVNVL